MSPGVKIIGFFLLLSGWFIALAAVMLLKSGVSQAAFVLGALGVQLLGIVLVVRAHVLPKGDAT